MNSGRTVFAQVMDFLPLPEFQSCVDRYQGDYKVKSFSCLDQFLCLVFAQLTSCESLRDIETCLRVQQSKLYHMGFRGRVSRNTLAHANQHRDWRVFAEFAQGLIARARALHRDEKLVPDLTETVYAIDSTTIHLCPVLFPWAQLRRSRSALKVHTLLDVRGSIPAGVCVASGATHDLHYLDQVRPEAAAIYLLDRGYLDFARLAEFTQASAQFIIRAKQVTQFDLLACRPVDFATGLRSDQTIVLNGPRSAGHYPHPLRRIQYSDAKKNVELIFLTNVFLHGPLEIAQLYRARWRVEQFFRWIKQHLRIQAFYGTSPNAVQSQVWVAIAVYVLVAIVKKRLGLEHSMHEILQILRSTLFEKRPIVDCFGSSAGGVSGLQGGDPRVHDEQ